MVANNRYKVEPVSVGALQFKLEYFANFDAEVDTFFEEVAKQVTEEKYWPVFGNLWAAAIGLAQYLANAPAAPHLAGRRVLELGCGLGLPSMVAARLGAQVLASDFHPEVAELLGRNLQRNELEAAVGFQRLDWADGLDCEPFDLIMASDILYEPEPPHALIAFLQRHLKDDGRVVIGDIGRVYFARFLSLMGEAGFSLQSSEEQIDDHGKPQRVHIASFTKGAATPSAANKSGSQA